MRNYLPTDTLNFPQIVNIDGAKFWRISEHLLQSGIDWSGIRHWVLIHYTGVSEFTRLIVDPPTIFPPTCSCWQRADVARDGYLWYPSSLLSRIIVGHASNSRRRISRESPRRIRLCQNDLSVVNAVNGTTHFPRHCHSNYTRILHNHTCHFQLRFFTFPFCFYIIS